MSPSTPSHGSTGEREWPDLLYVAVVGLGIPPDYRGSAVDDWHDNLPANAYVPASQLDQLREERDRAIKRASAQVHRADQAWERTGELLRERRSKLDALMQEEASADLAQLEAAASEVGPLTAHADKLQARVEELEGEAAHVRERVTEKQSALKRFRERTLREKKAGEAFAKGKAEGLQIGLDVLFALATSPPDGEGPADTPAEPEERCACGHTAHWHGDLPPDAPGAGSCEANSGCGCQRFHFPPDEPAPEVSQDCGGEG